MTAFPLRPLSEPLTPGTRESLCSVLLALQHWQRALDDWPRVDSAPDATPIVSLYASGSLVGCMGVAEGSPRERLLRAFLLANGDLRFGGIDSAQRDHLVVQVSYPLEPAKVELARVRDEVTPGVHGLALVNDGRPVVLLPDVALDRSLDGEGLLRSLEQKAGAERQTWPTGSLFRFRTERVLSRSDARANHESLEPRAAATRWLERRIESDGRVQFGIEPTRAGAETTGPLLLGRSAVVVQALQAARRTGVELDAADRLDAAKRWLAREAERALAGRPGPDWPTEPAQQAATVALLVHTGILPRAAAVPLAASTELWGNAWYAAEVATALGREAPDSLYDACVESLEREPWAPWTALAAHARADQRVFDRVCHTLCERVRRSGPYVGGVGAPLPEVALTALSAEVLALSELAAAPSARALALTFLQQSQLDGSERAAFVSPSSVRGAFPLSPVHHFLRADVTAHALLALA